MGERPVQSRFLRYKRFRLRGQARSGARGRSGSYKEVGHIPRMRKRRELLKIFPGETDLFRISPKPYKPHRTNLLTRIIRLSTEQDSIVLDSFAGSGTTAHAVLALNREDGGNRKFILVECEDYADGITAERVRRVIRRRSQGEGYRLARGSGRIVLTYCTLGRTAGRRGHAHRRRRLPDWPTLAAWLLHTASGVSAGPAELAQQNEDGLFHSDGATDFLPALQAGCRIFCKATKRS